MSIFNSISRGFGMRIGSNAANQVTKSSSIDGVFNGLWKFVKWCLIITFLIGVLQGIFG
jgi:hypothetical protein